MEKKLTELDGEEATRPIARSEPLRPQLRRRTSNPALVVLFALLLIGLGAATGVLGYKYWFEKPVQTSLPSAQDSVPKPVEKPKLTAKEVIEAANKALSSTLVDKDVAMPAIKIADYRFYVSLSLSKNQHGLTKQVAYTQSAIDKATVHKLLVEKGFVAKELQDNTGDQMHIVDYTQSDVVCRFTLLKTANNPSGPHTYQLGCADMTDYVAVSKALKQFYDLLPPESKTYDDAMLRGDVTPKASKTAGYQTLTLNVNAYNSGLGGPGAAYLFYQTPDKKWRFFTGTQSVLGCEKYNSSDLKKAYLGETCYEGGGAVESSVKL